MLQKQLHFSPGPDSQTVTLLPLCLESPFSEVYKKYGRGTQCFGLVDMVFDHRLNLMILKVFSNLNYSRILWALPIYADHPNAELSIIGWTIEIKADVRSSWILLWFQKQLRSYCWWPCQCAQGSVWILMLHWELCSHTMCKAKPVNSLCAVICVISLCTGWGWVALATRNFLLRRGFSGQIHV